MAFSEHSDREWSKYDGDTQILGSLLTAVTTVSNRDASSLSVNLQRSIWVSRRHTTNLTEASSVENLKPSDDTSHISDTISVSFPNTTIHERVSCLKCFLARDRQAQFISHNLDFFHMKMYGFEFGYSRLCLCYKVKKQKRKINVKGHSDQNVFSHSYFCILLFYYLL